MDTMTHANAVQDYLLAADIPDLHLYVPGGFWGALWSACCYWPHGELLSGVRCDGKGDTLDEAMADLRVKLDAAKSAAPILKTAAECKEAVLNLIREHDAAPASFRDAVDALPVKG
ncbi:MAG: hypothetical protein ABW169_09485 [Sphingobium sp.]